MTDSRETAVISEDLTVIDKALADLQADGSFAKMSNKWFDRDVSKPPVAK